MDSSTRAVIDDAISSTTPEPYASALKQLLRKPALLDSFVGLLQHGGVPCPCIFYEPYDWDEESRSLEEESRDCPVIATLMAFRSMPAAQDALARHVDEVLGMHQRHARIIEWMPESSAFATHYDEPWVAVGVRQRDNGEVYTDIFEDPQPEPHETRWEQEWLDEGT